MTSLSSQTTPSAKLSYWTTGSPCSVFDDFEPAFLVKEYLSSEESTGEYLSDVFLALELIVVAWFPVHHTCRHMP